jgi:hypothetical protein
MHPTRETYPILAAAGPAAERPAHFLLGAILTFGCVQPSIPWFNAPKDAKRAQPAGAGQSYAGRRRRPELRRPRPHAGAGQSYAGRGPTPAPAQSYAGRGPRGPRPQARPRRPKLYAGWAAVKMAMAKYWALPP